jgi:demethoxyubiquinone hydroxylase (CLK1/Coq7/Cat5 family)
MLRRSAWTTTKTFALQARQLSTNVTAPKAGLKNYRLPMERLTPKQRELVHRMLRVNQAGELGAVRIYQGQLAILGRTAEGPILKVQKK